MNIKVGRLIIIQDYNIGNWCQHLRPERTKGKWSRSVGTRDKLESLKMIKSLNTLFI